MNTKKILLLTAALAACTAQGQVLPPITYDVDADFQQAQSLADQDIMQGGGVSFKYRLRGGGRWLDLDGLGARWDARSSITSTASVRQVATVVTSTTPHYFRVDLDSDETGSVVTDWTYAFIVTESGVDYTLGTGRLDVVESSYSGAASVITNTTNVAYTDSATNALYATLSAEIDSDVTAATNNIGTTSCAGYVETNHTGQVTIDSANAHTNTFGGLLTKLGINILGGENSTASGAHGAMAVGYSVDASGDCSVALGFNSDASGDYSIGLGYGARATNDYALTWSGVSGAGASLGDGTFNIWPDGALDGFYISGTNLSTTLAAYATTNTLAGYVETNHTGSVSIDSANAHTNTFGGLKTKLGENIQGGLSTTASGDSGATALGDNTTASGDHGATALGSYTTASGDITMAFGYIANATHDYALTWSGIGSGGSAGSGTFNLWPEGALDGFYISGTNLTTILSNNGSTNSCAGYVETNHTGSVSIGGDLAVGTLSGTNSTDLVLGSDLDVGGYRIYDPNNAMLQIGTDGGNISIEQGSGDLSITHDLFVGDNVTVTNDLKVGGTIASTNGTGLALGSDLDASGYKIYDNVNALLQLGSGTGAVFVNQSEGDVSMPYGDLIVGNSATVTNDLTVGGDVTISGELSASASTTPYTISHSATVTVSKANGTVQALNAGASNVVIDISADTTNYVSTLRLELYGSGSVGFVTNRMSGTGDLDLSTDAWNTIMLDSGYGVTNWHATQIAR